MSVVDVIDDFEPITCTVTRRGAATIVKGRTVAGGTTTFPIVAQVQPVSGSDLKVLPAARYTEELRLLFTISVLSNLTDTVAFDGKTWEVIKVDGPWTLDEETHYRVYVARQDVPS